MPAPSQLIRSILAGALFALLGAQAQAQNFPNKPVRILVPYAAGGAVDVLARTIGQSLSKTWGQQPVIENRPGAGGIIASQALTQSPPDGYTLILVASGHPLNQFFYPKLPYDTFKDFTAISEVAASPLAIVVAKNSPVKNLQELLGIARDKPESLSYGMSGNGTSAHLAGELLNYMAKVKILAIPLQGRRAGADRRDIRRNSNERQSAAGSGRPARPDRARDCGDDGAAFQGAAGCPDDR